MTGIPLCLYRHRHDDRHLIRQLILELTVAVLVFVRSSESGFVTSFVTDRSTDTETCQRELVPGDDRRWQPALAARLRNSYDERLPF
ncbi:MAG: hypothetical protein OXC31_01180 [Spirochaetaceae bacterium]|nr:hypothetical protein [Spirochaetaceae bacterium]